VSLGHVALDGKPKVQQCLHATSHEPERMLRAEEASWKKEINCLDAQRPKILDARRIARYVQGEAGQ